MEMTYFDLCSMLKMNSKILGALTGKVLVYTYGKGAEVLGLSDRVEKGVRWVWYQVGEKLLKVKVSTVAMPEPYEYFVFGEFREVCFGRILG